MPIRVSQATAGEGPTDRGDSFEAASPRIGHMLYDTHEGWHALRNEGRGIVANPQTTPFVPQGVPPNWNNNLHFSTHAPAFCPQRLNERGHVAAVWAMPAASRPRSASSSPRSPCSMKRSGMPSRRTCACRQAGVGGRFQHGAAEAAHQRPLFDRDHERAVGDRRAGSSRVSSGLTKRALITPTSSPSLAQLRGGLARRWSAACRRR